MKSALHLLNVHRGWPLLLCNFMIAVDVHFWLLCAFLRDRLFPSVDATEDDDEIALCELGGPLSRFTLESTSRFLRDLLIPLVDAGIVVERESWGELCPLRVWSAVCWSWMLCMISTPIWTWRPMNS